MANFNSVHLLGRLVDDPKKVDTAKAVIAKFTLAINRSYTNKQDEKVEETSFVDIQAFGKTAELILQYSTKGRELLVDGELRQDKWKTPEGENRSKLVVNVNDFQFIGGPKQDNAPAKQEKKTNKPAPTSTNKKDDDIPF